jgi:large subunit ribosomal protein L13
MKTYTLKAKDVTRQWHVIDAADRPLGRLATEVAGLLRGKHKPTFTPNLDMGDYVVIVNAEKVRLTGDKLRQKTYYRHTGYPGGLRRESPERAMAKRPTRVIERAVRGMLPHNRLGRAQYRHLKVYAGAEHPHEAQVRAGLKREKKAEAPAEPEPRPEPEAKPRKRGRRKEGQD